MTCSICNLEITLRQSRHSDGAGDYHAICEFNVIRKRLGLPKFEDVLKWRYGSGHLPTISRGAFNPNYKGKKDLSQIIHFM